MTKQETKFIQKKNLLINFYIKVSLIFLSAIFLNTVTFAAQEECIELTQSAVSPDGVCTQFETSCEIPSNWKVVPSCNLIKETSFGTSLEDRMNNRFYGKNYVKKNKSTEKDNIRTSGKFRRQGSGYLTRTGRYRQTRLNESQGKSYLSRKTFTKKNYSKETREKIKSLNIQKGGFQHEGDLTKEERKTRRAYRAPIESATQMNRSGYLSSKQKFSTEMETRSNSARVGSKRIWKNLKQISQTKKKRVYKGITLRKLWRGERLEGILE
ncbi:hypothetical protein KAI58_03615 [Candidatus Gracilibacteria bacterium]|nr:hypothetical protein [Candidatus Gracilibacteria bacterium]